MLLQYLLLVDTVVRVDWRSGDCRGHCSSGLCEGCLDLLLRQTFLGQKVSLDLL